MNKRIVFFIVFGLLQNAYSQKKIEFEIHTSSKYLRASIEAQTTIISLDLGLNIALKNDSFKTLGLGFVSSNYFVSHNDNNDLKQKTRVMDNGIGFLAWKQNKYPFFKIRTSILASIQYKSNLNNAIDKYAKYIDKEKVRKVFYSLEISKTCLFELNNCKIGPFIGLNVSINNNGYQLNTISTGKYLVHSKIGMLVLL